MTKKPFVTFYKLTPHSNSDVYVDILLSKCYSTYRDLKRNMLKYFSDKGANLAIVTRFRRGQWGQWFEHWEEVDGKLKIIKQGWL